MQEAISIDHLTKRYGKFTAIDDLSLSVKKNSFVGLLGPNGAGKSTLLKITSNLARPTSGSVLINGINVSENPKDALMHVGILVETLEFYPNYTPRQIYQLVGEIKGMLKENIHSQTEEILEEMKMLEWADNKISTFSKGMKQRIAIGQSLIGDPHILIFDEPTSGLDPRGMADVRNILIELKSHSDLTVIFSSHMLSDVKSLCDNVVVINHGKLMLNENISNALLSENSRMIKIKFDQKPTMEHIDTLQKIDHVVNACFTNDEVTLALKGGINEQIEVLSEIAKLDLKIIDMSESDSLESAYLALIKESA